MHREGSLRRFGVGASRCDQWLSDSGQLGGSLIFAQGFAPSVRKTPGRLLNDHQITSTSSR